MGALSYLNLASNGIAKLVLPEGWSEKYEDAASFGYTHGDGREQKEAPEGSKPEGAIAIANAIKDMGALSVLSLKKNGLGTKEAGKVLGEMLKVNSVLQELDLSDNIVLKHNGGDAPGFAQELAIGIKDNGALSIGCIVSIQGLSKSPRLNGMGAKVLQRITMADASIEA
jgi:hypothetical protein